MLKYKKLLAKKWPYCLLNIVKKARNKLTWPMLKIQILVKIDQVAQTNKTKRKVTF